MQVFTDSLHKIAYATDASVYREVPYGVAYPKTISDVLELLKKASEKGIDLIPRGGGTSLAGQVVGSGIVVDISKHWNQILEINAEERWARVQPGVVRDELNIALKPYGLFFSPETSTSNRLVGWYVVRYAEISRVWLSCFSTAVGCHIVSVGTLGIRW